MLYLNKDNLLRYATENNFIEVTWLTYVVNQFEEEFFYIELTNPRNIQNMIISSMEFPLDKVVKNNAL